LKLYTNVNIFIVGGSLEFVDTNEFLIMNSTDHFQMSDVEWDPTGRYVFTAVSYWKCKVDTGKLPTSTSLLDTK